MAFGSFGEDPIGMQDKMTSTDILRMFEDCFEAPQNIPFRSCL